MTRRTTKWTINSSQLWMDSLNWALTVLITFLHFSGFQQRGLNDRMTIAFFFSETSWPSNPFLGLSLSGAFVIWWKMKQNNVCKKMFEVSMTKLHQRMQWSQKLKEENLLNTLRSFIVATC